MRMGIHHIPEKYLSEVIYGDTIRSLAVDLYSEGNMSLERIQTLFASLSNHAVTISQGSIFRFLNRFAELSGPSLKQIELELLNEKTLCTDATYVSTYGAQTYYAGSYVFASEHSTKTECCIIYGLLKRKKYIDDV